MRPLRVLTLNIWGTNGDWPARRDALRKGVRELDPDLVALQECVLHDGYEQCADIFDETYRTLTSAVRDPTHRTGIAVVTRLPVKRIEEIDLHVTPRTRDSSATALLVRVGAAPWGDVIFVNHFPSWEPERDVERELQSIEVAGRIEQLVGREHLAVIVAGDMDATPTSTSIRFWTGRRSLGGLSVRYDDAWQASRGDGATYTPVNPLVARDRRSRRIDYVLLRRDERHPPRITACRRVFDRPVGDVWATDHFGVFVTIGT